MTFKNNFLIIQEPVYKGRVYKGIIILVDFIVLSYVTGMCAELTYIYFDCTTLQSI